MMAFAAADEVKERGAEGWATDRRAVAAWRLRSMTGESGEVPTIQRTKGVYQRRRKKTMVSWNTRGQAADEESQSPPGSLIDDSAERLESESNGWVPGGAS